MSNKDFLEQILNLRKQCLAKVDEDNTELSKLHRELLKWQEQIINQLNQFIEEKFHEIKQKRLEINRQQIRQLDILYSNCLSKTIDHDNKEYYSQLFDDVYNLHSSIQIFYPKQIDFKQYVQLNIDRLDDMDRSLVLDKNTNHFNLSSYQLHLTLPIQSNVTSLFATYDRLLVYYDHYTSSASLHIFDLQSYLEQSNHNRSYLKFRVPCKEFQGKIMHIEYCLYLQEFLIATSSKLFLLQIPNTCTNYRVTEYFDIVHKNLPGILQKFTCHPTSSNLLYLLINTFSQHTLVQIDLNQKFSILQKWDYPKNDSLLTPDNHTTKHNSQLTAINDFALGKDTLVFAVTYESNKFQIQLHIRSSDMHLQHRLILNTTFSPLRICMIPCDYSSEWNKHEQFIVISQKSKSLLLYDINTIDDDDQIHSIDEIILDTEPEYIGFANKDLSILLIRNLFHIAMYKRMNNNPDIRQRPSLLFRADNILS